MKVKKRQTNSKFGTIPNVCVYLGNEYLFVIWSFRFPTHFHFQPKNKPVSQVWLNLIGWTLSHSIGKCISFIWPNTRCVTGNKVYDTIQCDTLAQDKSFVSHIFPALGPYGLTNDVSALVGHNGQWSGVRVSKRHGRWWLVEWIFCLSFHFYLLVNIKYWPNKYKWPNDGTWAQYNDDKIFPKLHWLDLVRASKFPI